MTVISGLTTIPTGSVKAEEAPLGVLLWPVMDEKYADNFTLERVGVFRSELSEWVEWTYLSGAKRTFRVGEEVTVMASALVDR